MSRTFDEVYETVPGTGWLTKPEAELLYKSARQTRGAILEVGCYHGRSSVLLASLSRTLYCVDPFSNFDTGDMDGRQAKIKFIENLTSRGHPVFFGANNRGKQEPPFGPNVYLFQQKIEQWEIRAVGFAYLDGDHTLAGTLNQLNVALEAGARIVCVHDYADDGEGVNVKDAIYRTGLTVAERVERMVMCRV